MRYLDFLLRFPILLLQLHFFSNYRLSTMHHFVICPIAISILFLLNVLPSRIVAAEGEHFSHAVYDSLLQVCVSGGKVYYNGFRTPAFAAYREQLATASPSTWGKDEQFAFWLNAYNASVIANVLAYPGVRMVQNIEGFFDRDTFRIAGKSLTLNQVLNEVLRPTFREPLLCFGVVQASLGSPPLPNRAFRAATVRKVLRQNARKFLRTERGVVLDIGANVLLLSRVFEWYREDFGEGDKELLALVVQHVRETDAAYIAVHRSDIMIKFLPHDWTLNGRSANPERENSKPYEKPHKKAITKAKK